MSRVKICDFGVSNTLDLTRNTFAAKAGTYRFMPPEQFDGVLNTKIDIWALGCILIQMITGKPPYFGSNTEQTIYMQARTYGP
jgi:serine/threonine protein kinase